MNWRSVFLLPGLILILAGVLLPRAWYDTLPQSEGDLPWIWKGEEAEAAPVPPPPPPVRGVTLLQISLIAEGFILLGLGLTRRRYRRLSAGERPSITTASSRDDPGSVSLWVIAVITVLGFVLRLYRLDSDLWLDEVTTVLVYGPMPPLHVATAFVSASNHLLYTLLMKLAIALFGEHEWAIRLPAAVFGTSTIPALYWVSRLVLSRRSSVLAALILAVSYHHIFFSQNARGYSMQLFFATVACGLLVKGLQEDRLRTWVLYVAAMFLSIASILNGIFVLAAHIVVGTAALVMIRRRGASPLPLLHRLAAVFGATALLAVQLYSTFIPQAYVYAQMTWRDPASGFPVFSAELLAEMIRGISAGVGGGFLLLALPVVGVTAGVGLAVLLKRQWILLASLGLPVILSVAYLVVNRLTIAPRSLLLALPLAILVAVQGVDSMATFVGQRITRITRLPGRISAGLATGIVLLGCVLSLASLRRYYSVPKQPFRASLEFIEGQRKPDEPILAVHLAENGYRFYAGEFNLEEGVDFFAVRSVESLDRILASQGGRGPYLVTTFPRGLRLTHPDLEARVARDWEVVRTFPATVGDAGISVWRQRQIGVREETDLRREIR